MKGNLITGDLQDNTLTFEFEVPVSIVAGEYTITKIEEEVYTFADLLADLKKMTPEEKERPVIVWREEEAYPIGGLTNDRQAYYKDEEGLHLPKDQYDQLSREDRDDWELSKPNGITVLCEDF